MEEKVKPPLKYACSITAKERDIDGNPISFQVYAGGRFAIHLLRFMKPSSEIGSKYLMRFDKARRVITIEELP